MDEEHKLAVVLFADIAGYTSLMQQDEKKALHTLTMFKKALQVATSGHTGKIVQYFGDGCLMTFESAVNALDCAIALHNDFTSTDVPVRIGLHLGDIVYKEGNAFGDGVNLASRVESMGVPGAVLMSKTLRDQIKNKKEYVLESMGTYQFKNVDEVIEIFALANPGFKIPVKGEMTGKLAPEYSSNKRRLQSLAVLPFVNYSGDSKQNFFVDGMHDAVIAEVARITQLNVISRTSVLKFKDTSLSIPEIADKLHVEAIIEGSVLRSHRRVRINLQLIRASPEEKLWSKTYEEDVTDILSLFGNVAKDVAFQIKIFVQPKEAKRFSRQQQVDPKAYENYLRGRYFSPLIYEDAMRSIELYKMAIKKAPDFAAPYVALAATFVWQCGIGSMPFEPTFSDAKMWAEKGLKLDPGSGEANAIIAKVSIMRDWDWKRSASLFERAVSLEPNNAWVLIEAVLFAGCSGRFAYAKKLADKAISVDPLSPDGGFWRGWSRYMAREFEEAVEIYEKSSKEHPLYAHYYEWIAAAYAKLGQKENVIKFAQKAESMVGETFNLDFLVVLGHAYAEAGVMDEAQRLLSKIEKVSLDDGGLIFRATLLGTMLRHEEAHQLLTISLQKKFPLCFVLPHHPIFDRLRSYPPTAALINTIGAPAAEG